MRERRKAEGLERLEVWAPKIAHERIRNFAKRVSKPAKQAQAVESHHE